MRTIGEIPHPRLKITLFRLNQRLSVQFEAGMLTQIYKFREGEGLESAQDLQRLIDDPFIQAVERRMRQMQENALQAMGRFRTNDREDEFDEII